jgi:para-aminobenzoate synthetase component 1
MLEQVSFPVDNVNRLGDQLCRWLSSQNVGIILRSNEYHYGNPLNDNLSRYQLLAGIGESETIKSSNSHFQNLKNHIDRHEWLFGFLGYDLKNEIEKLSSSNHDGLNFPDMFFYNPKLIFAVNENLLTIHFDGECCSEQSVENLLDDILQIPIVQIDNNSDLKFSERFSKKEYLDTIKRIIQHIHRGDIYEMNLCQEFYASPSTINPYETFINLNGISPTPFSAFGKFNDKYLMCASPERFLQKYGQHIVSQPIKGTSRRGATPKDDDLLKEMLITDKKERAENIMIVDLVRNDLSRVAQRGSVSVDELCGVYPFRQVNQMISTVSCILDQTKHPVDAIKATFPMGSMTGAPKVMAMQLIEKYEKSRRGLFSGAVGYFTPYGDFDFNVVIRSILYNKTSKYLSYSVGGAITANSVPEKEYEECLLKASAIEQALRVTYK